MYRLQLSLFHPDTFIQVQMKKRDTGMYNLHVILRNRCLSSTKV